MPEINITATKYVNIVSENKMAEKQTRKHLFSGWNKPEMWLLSTLIFKKPLQAAELRFTQ